MFDVESSGLINSMTDWSFYNRLNLLYEILKSFNQIVCFFSISEERPSTLAEKDRPFFFKWPSSLAYDHSDHQTVHFLPEIFDHYQYWPWFMIHESNIKNRKWTVLRVKWSPSILAHDILVQRLCSKDKTINNILIFYSAHLYKIRMKVLTVVKKSFFELEDKPWTWVTWPSQLIWISENQWILNLSSEYFVPIVFAARHLYFPLSARVAFLIVK